MPIPAELGAGTFRLLVIDDEKAVIDSLKRAFRREGPHVEVTGTTSATEGVLMLAEEKPNAALIDLNMPELDGFQVLRHVHARKELQSVALVAMTSRLNADVIARAMKAGAVECLGKPVDPKGFLSRFRAPIAMATGAKA